MRIMTEDMIRFLDVRKGKDLIKTAAEFREEFILSEKEAALLISEWVKLT